MSRKVLSAAYRVCCVSSWETHNTFNRLVILRLPVTFTNTTRKMSANTGHFEANTSVDSQQIEHLGSFANDWWDPQGLFKALHSMNSLRIPLIRDGLIATNRVDPSFANTAFPLKGTKILDVGCGGGILSEPLSRLGAEVTGIDASGNLIEAAKAHAQIENKLKDNLTYIKITAEEHVQDHRDYYDAVVASEVIEHVNNHDFFVKNCVELTKPGGSVFMTTMTKSNMAWLGGIIAAEYLLGIVPKGTHDWNLFITPETLQKLLEKYGCHTKLIHGMMYFPVVNKWCWAPNVCINYAIQVVKTPA